MEDEFCEICENLINLEEPSVEEKDGKIILTSRCGSCGNIRKEVITDGSIPKIYDYIQINSKRDSVALFRGESLRKIIIKNFTYPRERKTCKKCGHKIAVILQHPSEIVRIYVCERCAEIVE